MHITISYFHMTNLYSEVIFENLSSYSLFPSSWRKWSKENCQNAALIMEDKAVCVGYCLVFYKCPYRHCNLSWEIGKNRRNSKRDLFRSIWGCKLKNFCAVFRNQDCNMKCFFFFFSKSIYKKKIYMCYLINLKYILPREYTYDNWNTVSK